MQKHEHYKVQITKKNGEYLYQLKRYKMELQPEIKWTSQTKWIDLDTGEIIQKEKQKEYIIIKTIKNVKINQLQTKGTISYTKECRKHPQLQLNLT